MTEIINLNKDNFEKVMNESKTPVIVDFWAEWCGPCKMIAPILDEISVELKDKVLVTKVNLDDNQDLALKYSIRSIPSILLFEDGNLLDIKVGLSSKSDLLGWIESKSSK
jgi:thioredoxin 1